MTRQFALLLTAAAIAVPAPSALAAGTPGSRAEVVVKVDRADGYTIDDIAADLPIELQSAVLASHGIYLVRSTSERYTDDPGKTNDLAHKIQDHKGVVYAEPDFDTKVADTRFHSWPEGDPEYLGDDGAAWLDQPAVGELDLVELHGRSTGTGVTVAVLDTGVDASHPALAGKVLPGWDYVGDDPDVSDVADAGHGVSAVGHGTFVSGVVSLAAPGASILPLRVLDSDGDGDIFTLAEAIRDAVSDGADVINLSLGTAVKQSSNLVSDAIKAARRRGVLVVAATGNDGSNAPHYPAMQPEVLSVSALDPTDTALAGFSVWGDWVDVAAPGVGVVGPLPGGGFAVWAGTSVAAPFVAGEAALVRSAAPQLNVDKLKAAICASARHLSGKRVHFGAVDPLGSLEYAATHR
jgi:subtilisin family serine protease